MFWFFSITLHALRLSLQNSFHPFTELPLCLDAEDTTDQTEAGTPPSKAARQFSNILVIALFVMVTNFLFNEDSW